MTRPGTVGDVCARNVRGNQWSRVQFPASSGAGDGTRTRDPELGKLMLYQLSYARTARGLSMDRRACYSIARSR